MRKMTMKVPLSVARMVKTSLLSLLLDPSQSQLKLTLACTNWVLVLHRVEKLAPRGSNRWSTPTGSKDTESGEYGTGRRAVKKSRTFSLLTDLLYTQSWPSPDRAKSSTVRNFVISCLIISMWLSSDSSVSSNKKSCLLFAQRQS